MDRQVDGHWQKLSCLAMSHQLIPGLPSANQLNLLGCEYIQMGTCGYSTGVWVNDESEVT